MKKLFQRWLLLFVGLAFFITLGASYWIHSFLARQSALEILRMKLMDAQRQIERTGENLETVRNMSNQAALAKSRAFARIVAADPSVLQRTGELEKIARELDVDELHVSDAKGILIASLPAEYRGYDMSKARQSAEFLGAIGNPDFALVQEPRENGILKILFQYAGVARRDQPGIIQIGYRPERLEKAMRVADVNTIAASFRIGNDGRLQIEPRPASIVSDDSEEIYRKSVNGHKSLCLSVPCGKYLLTGNLPEEEMYLSRNSVVRILVVGNLILFGVIFLLVTALLQKVVVHGIYSVNSSLEKITEGNLDEKINVHTTDEFNALSCGINSTVDALKRAIENEARRIDAELELGRTIQTSVLPAGFPDGAEFRLAAAMFTAKEVGGDFYDFFWIDEAHLAVLIADVSGKGITAALYMMNSKTLLKEMIQAERDPARAVQMANEELCRNNTAHMFVTAFLAVLDMKTGVISCVNAGHNPPLIKHADGSCEYLRLKHSLVLGCSEKSRYAAVPVAMASGDRLLLYTDGVTEAMNPVCEQYGEERLKELLESLEGTPADVLKNIREELKKFADGAPQADDITVLMLDYRPPSPASSIDDGVGKHVRAE